MQIKQWLDNAKGLIQSDSPLLDAQLLLCHAIDKNTTYLMTWPENQLDLDQLNLAEGLLQKRINGLPIAYILGQQEFFSLPFLCNSSTLIPRPDTECLIEYCLDNFDIHGAKTVVDLGTGTGAIAITLKSEFKNWQISAVDFQKEACDLAKKNAQLNHQNINVIESSWLDNFDSNSLDIVLSNPPYIEEHDHHLDEGDVRFEPKSALTSGVDGLDDIKIITQQAFNCLKENGQLIVEHGYNQATRVREIFTKNGFIDVESFQDYASNDRYSVAIKPKKAL
ncbi:MAG: peptide chain release factor N(5)-glutamine methyltransferase [Saccharospirillaceae bacterium]|nr:peptide chain release factor N(5)-glutamine methyltransferase [Pseudomonadales bacterium]NRB79033.1 peptide chain release factor N(5)-glutamine methyltransferase [Saccharospirillaceae bacterium]